MTISSAIEAVLHETDVKTERSGIGPQEEEPETEPSTKSIGQEKRGGGNPWRKRLGSATVK
ncbi:hypothetical protein JI435_419500 [Parastagonospora nodorum SN15]|jgi:hypothetical protein|uniref:Uncharacterized protein n=1 Tax=Phaeosphaeria nodorum (strain SN15 / ATCC MYA-4574 / FGSC 10173) TaxID=321614 RepID=A0A7U2FDS3_PHANO|nr:hypothetical protein JI435_419500 [Parastagonospora nodorum SN15]